MTLKNNTGKCTATGLVMGLAELQVELGVLEEELLHCAQPMVVAKPEKKGKIE